MAASQKINSTTMFSDSKGEHTFQIYHKLDCHAAWVIFMMECKICKLLYIGKSETKCNTRDNNHRSHMRTLKNSCELSEHFLHNRQTYDYKNDVTITLISQLPSKLCFSTNCSFFGQSFNLGHYPTIPSAEKCLYTN